MMPSLSKKAAKEISYLTAKWIAKYGGRVYGSALSYARAAEMAIIPNKIGSIVIKGVPKNVMYGVLSYADTFLMFPGYFDDGSKLMKKFEKNMNSFTSERERTLYSQKVIGPELNAYFNKWRTKIGIQSIIDTIQLFIPIPFGGVGH